MSMQFEDLCNIFCEVMDMKKDKITKETRIIKDIKADSLDVYRVFILIEEKFQINMEEIDYTDIETIGDLWEIIEGLNETA